MSKNPHYFIGISLPMELKEKLVQWQMILKNNLSYKQWTHKKDFHITLKFLGPVSTDEIMKLKRLLHKTEKLSAFSLTIDGIHYFGNPVSPRVLFSYVESSDQLSKLAELVDSFAFSSGFDKENRPFRPHITLAKKWKDVSQKVDLSTIITEFKHEKFTITVDRINLFQIHPMSSPKYETVETYMLKEGDENRTID